MQRHVEHGRHATLMKPACLLYDHCQSWSHTIYFSLDTADPMTDTFVAHRDEQCLLHMHSADYCICIAQTTGMPWHSHTCPSHGGIVSKRLYIPSNFFSPSGSPPPIILVFQYQMWWQYSEGDPLTGASNAWGVWKNHDFRPICRLTSELMQDRAIVTMEGEQETTLKFSSGTNFNDLEWPLNQISRSRYYSTSNNSKNGKR